MPSKFLIETALEVGIDNLEKSRNTDPKKLYEEVKEALKTETSPEIKSLYERYISLYDASTRTASLRRGELSESIKWKNISDLKEAVKNAGKGLSLADIEGLNQYALAEYARQQSRDVGHQDDTVLTTLKSWFQIYEKIKAETVETQKLGFDAALRDAFLKADKVPFDFEYRENGETKKVTVNLKDNTLIIGGRTHALTGDKIQIGKLALDAKKFYIPYTKEGVDQNFALTLEKAEFLRRYMTDILDGKDIRVDSYLVHVGRSGEVSPTTSQGAVPTRVPESRKYDLATCAGYAAQELKRYGKTIKELQSALKAKKFYTGKINGNFDQATLDAVVAFQKTIKDSKYEPNGLVGDETISNLFGIKPQPILSPQRPSQQTPRRTDSPATGPGTIPGDTRRTDGAVEPSRRPQSNTPSQPRREGVTEAVPVVLKSLDVAMKNFRKVITDVSQKSGYIFDTPEEIKKSQAAVNESLKPVLSAIQSLEGKKLSAEEKAQYDSAVMEVSRYFSNDIDRIKNRHYRNHDLAFDLAFSLIQDDLKRQNITFKPRPTGDTVLASLERLDPKLHAKLKADLRNGYNLGQILSNPQVRSQYEKVYEKIYGEWENEMQALLKKLKENRPTLASIEGNAALNQMISIMGTTDFWDTKARTRDVAGQTIGMIGSTAVGVGAFMLTPVTGGTSAVLGAAILGGSFSTLGMIATKGRAGWDKETFTELGVNVASFGLGGLAARTANIYIQSGKAIGIASGIALDAAAGLAIGITGDYARAWSLDTGIDLWPAIRNNLPWALLPIGLGMKGALRVRAEHVKDTMDRARTQVKMGDVAGAQATIKQAEPEVTALAEEAKKVVPKEHTQVQSVTQNTQPSVKDASGVEYARRPDGVYKKTPDAGAQWEKIDDIALKPEIKSQLDQVQAPPAAPAKPAAHPPAEGQAHATPEGIQHQTVTPENIVAAPTQNISNWIASAIPKNAKIDVPIELGNIKITPKKGGKYQLDYQGKSINFENLHDLGVGVNNIVKTPKERISIIQSSNTKMMDKHLASLHETIVPGSNPPIRLMRTSEGKMEIEVRGEHGGWVKKSIDSLTEDETVNAFAHFTSKTPQQIREGLFRAKSATLDDAMTPAEKEGFIKKYGKPKWDALAKSVKDAPKGGWEGLKYVFGLATGIGRSSVNWKWAVAGTSVPQMLEYFWNMNDNERNWDPTTKAGLINYGEVVAQILAFRYMGFVRGFILTEGYRVIPAMYEQTRAANAGAQVPTNN